MSIHTPRSDFIRALRLAILGPALGDVCVGIFAVTLVACGPASAARRGSESVRVESSGGEGSAERDEDYALVEPGVLAREGELEGVPFLEVVLGTDDPGAPLPLLVVIHGLGDTPDIPVGPYRGLSRPVRVVLPRGPLAVDGGGFAWMSVRVRDGETERLSVELREQEERLARFLVALAASRATEGPTVVIGFSQGGMLTLALATHHPDLVGLALPLAGWLPPALREDVAETTPRIVWMHGTSDERIPFELAAEVSEELRERGLDVVLVPFADVGHFMSDEMDATFHAWLERVLDNLATQRAIGDGLPLD